MSALIFVIILLCVIVSSLCIALKLLIEDFREVRIKVLKLETAIEADDFADEFVNGLKDLHIIEADRKTEQTENSSEKPNNCEDAENPSGDVWECGCFLDTYCEHQIYDMNPDGTINIVECGYEPKDEPQTDCPWK